MILQDKNKDTISRLSEMRKLAEYKCDEMAAKISSLVEKRENSRSLLISIETQLIHQKENGAFLLSRKTDSSRQVTEAERLLASRSDTGDLAANQPLDFESEQNRRRFAVSARSINARMKLLKDRVGLLSSANEYPHDLAPLLQATVDLYSNTKSINGTLRRLEGKVNETAKSAQFSQKGLASTGQSTYGLSPSKPKSKYRKRDRMQPISFSPTLRNVPTTLATTPARVTNWESIETKLQQMAEQQTKTTRLTGLSRPGLSGISSSVNRERTGARSLLQSPVKAAALTQPHTPDTSTTALFSPRSTARARADWDNVPTVDQNKARDRKSTRLNSSHDLASRMPSSA